MFFIRIGCFIEVWYVGRLIIVFDVQQGIYKQLSICKLFERSWFLFVGLGQINDFFFLIELNGCVKEVKFLIRVDINSF